MTIDEAIKRHVDNADYERAHGNLQGCLEFKQLAKWLKELKQLRKQEPCEDEIILTKEEYGQLLSNEFDNGYAKGYREALEQDSILDKIRADVEDLDVFYDNDYFSSNNDAMFKRNDVLQIIDKYKAEMENVE